MREWATEHAPLVDVELATAKLRDHTFKTAISDWPGAWRNWLRRDQESAESRKPGANKPQAESFRERDERRARERWEEITGRRSNAPIDITPSVPFLEIEQ